MLTKVGAKLLDFGLARLDAPTTTSSVSYLPTQAKGLTQAGTVLGTFQYMSPEQLEGKEADARADIFAFGAALRGGDRTKSVRRQEPGESDQLDYVEHAAADRLVAGDDAARARPRDSYLPREGSR